MKAVTVLLFVAVAHAQLLPPIGKPLPPYPNPAFQYTSTNLPGICPTVEAISSLNVAAVLGNWYRVATNYKNDLCADNGCQTAYLAQYNASMITADNCCQSASNPGEAVCGTAVGSGALTPLNAQGLFNWNFGTEDFSAVALDTDYENYLITYGCRPDGPLGLKRVEQISVYTRNGQLDAMLASRYYEVFVRNGVLSALALINPSQGKQCAYNYVPRACDWAALIPKLEDIPSWVWQILPLLPGLPSIPGLPGGIPSIPGLPGSIWA